MIKHHDIAVILHLYYPELWDEIRDHLENLDGNFDLYVSIPFHVGESIIPAIRASYPAARIIRFENRGRDIAPFVEIFSAIAPIYKLICKIHSKKSLHRTDGNNWRHELYEQLMGSPEKVKDILDAFESNPLVGMIGPAGHAKSIRDASITGFEAYKNIFTAWSDKIGVERLDQLDFHFFAGSMFWFRPKALMPMLNLNIQQENFEMEIGAIDGTLAHALERFFPVAVFAAGFQVYDTRMLAPGTLSSITPSYRSA